jgi:hypothetical protein
MNYKQAIKKMGEYGDYSELCSWENIDPDGVAVGVVFDAVAPLCKTSTESGKKHKLGLRDYLFTQAGWQPTDTPEKIAAEWDALNA